MRTVTRESLPLLAGAAVGTGGIGTVLALADIASPLRAPLTFFFLLVAPGAALVSGLTGLDPLTRVVVAAAASMTVDLLVGVSLLALHQWSVRSAVALVTAVSALSFLAPLARRGYARAQRITLATGGRTGRITPWHRRILKPWSRCG